MDLEDQISQQLHDSSKAIAGAENLITQMAALRRRLFIKEGAGQRYLQRVQPSAAQLQQVEQRMHAEYGRTPPQKSNRKAGKANLLQAIRRRGLV